MIKSTIQMLKSPIKVNQLEVPFYAKMSKEKYEMRNGIGY
jgi:hypothetical protein